MEKGKTFLAKRLGGLLAILLAILAILMFVPSVELQVIDIEGELAMQDFGSVSYATVPDSFRNVTDALKEEAPDFDYNVLCGKILTLLIFTVVCAVICLRAGTNVAAMLLTVALSVYGIVTYTGSYSFYFAHENNYIFHIVLMALAGLLALANVIVIIRRRAREKQPVSVHAVLSDITAVLLLIPVFLMFLPFTFQTGSSVTTSIMGYVLFPLNHAELGTYLSSPSMLGAGYDINMAVLVPLLVALLGILGSIFALQSGTKLWTTILPLVWGLVGVIGFLASAFLALDPNRFIYVIVFVVGLVLAGINLALHIKRYREME